MLAKIVWTLWALVPVVGLSYHFGAGQKPYNEDRARDLLLEAALLEQRAEQAQDAAYAAHLAALNARHTAHASQSAEDERLAREAATREDKAYRVAAAAWKATADKLQSAQDLLAGSASERVNTVRVARNRALIHAGEISNGVGDLEDLLESLATAGQENSPLARQARDEAATGYYYGARILRAAGKPAAEWREVSGLARQNFRYLAETSKGASGSGQTGAGEDFDGFQKNLELVLNLEQSAAEDLFRIPRPKKCPGDGNCDGLSKCNGKNKRPPRTRNDGRGAGGVGDIEGGW